MKLKRFLIKLLSSSGEVLNTVTCPAGRITVLRAQSPAELDPYQRAIAGIPGGERFALDIDGAQFVPTEHLLIGFGEDLSSVSISVSEYLAPLVGEASLHSTLVSYGLDSVADRQVSTLTQCEQRRLLLLAATYQPDKLLALHNPFEPIASKWRERFAELLTTHTRATERIVLVTALDYRPDTWVDNELIQRVQVGLDSRKTVGFSGSPSQLKEFVDDVRKNTEKSEGRSSSSKPPTSDLTARSKSSPTTKKHRGQKVSIPNLPPGVTKPLERSKTVKRFKRRIRALLGISAVAIFAAIYAGSLQSPSPSVGGPDQGGASGGTGSVTLASPIATETPNNAVAALPNGSTPAAVTTAQPPPVEMAFVLDLYGPEIKRSIIRSFDGTATAKSVPTPPRTSGRTPSWESQSEKTASTQAGGLLKALEGASGTGENVKPSFTTKSVSGSQETVADLTPDEREQRRELIRQKFLEAISRANEAR